LPGKGEFKSKKEKSGSGEFDPIIGETANTVMAGRKFNRGRIQKEKTAACSPNERRENQQKSG